MKESDYADVCRRITQIRRVFDKKTTNNEPDPTTELVEIETHINKILKFMQLAKIADHEQVERGRKQLLKEYKARNLAAMQLREEQLKLEQQ